MEMQPNCVIFWHLQKMAVI